LYKQLDIRVETKKNTLAKYSSYYFFSLKKFAFFAQTAAAAMEQPFSKENGSKMGKWFRLVRHEIGFHGTFANMGKI
jgi:hypothetical protein